MTSDEELMRRYRDWERDHFLFFVVPVGVVMCLGLLALAGWGIYSIIT